MLPIIFLPFRLVPQALRLARCQAAQLFQRNVGDLPNESNVLDQSILHGEASILALNTKVVMALEDLYSCRRSSLFPWLIDEVAHTMGYRQKDQTLRKPTVTC